MDMIFYGSNHVLFSFDCMSVYLSYAFSLCLCLWAGFLVDMLPNRLVTGEQRMKEAGRSQGIVFLVMRIGGDCSK